MASTPMPNNLIADHNGHDKESAKDSILNNAQSRIKDTVEDVRKELKHEVDMLAKQVDKVKDEVKKTYKHGAEIIQDKMSDKKFDLRAVAGVFLVGLAIGKLISK